VTNSNNIVIWWFKRVTYRLWQFKQTIMPRLDAAEWRAAVSGLEKPLQAYLDSLRKSEKAHIQRVCRAVNEERQIDERQRSELRQLALLHDIGKSIMRSSVIMKVARVFLPIGRNEHCIAGARLLKRHGFDRTLVRRVLRHHTYDHDDRLLSKFQQIDDSC
jgi:putative nucleotidyltransferase with HDIG domain